MMVWSSGGESTTIRRRWERMRGRKARTGRGRKEKNPKWGEMAVYEQ
jgi:hypothetical protein